MKRTAGGSGGLKLLGAAAGDAELLQLRCDRLLLFFQIFSKLFEVARSRVPLGSLIPAPRPRLASNNNIKKKN